jgi:hypothetical protein
MGGLVLARFAPVNGIRRAFTRAARAVYRLNAPGGRLAGARATKRRMKGARAGSGTEPACGDAPTLLLVRRMFLHAKLIGSSAI